MHGALSNQFVHDSSCFMSSYIEWEMIRHLVQNIYCFRRLKSKHDCYEIPS